MSVVEQLQSISQNFERARQQTCRSSLESEFKDVKKALVREAEFGATSVLFPATKLGVCQCTGNDVKKFYADKGLQATLEPSAQRSPSLPNGAFLCTRNVYEFMTANTRAPNPNDQVAAYDQVKIAW